MFELSRWQTEKNTQRQKKHNLLDGDDGVIRTDRGREQMQYDGWPCLRVVMVRWRIAGRRFIIIRTNSAVTQLCDAHHDVSATDWPTGYHTSRRRRCQARPKPTLYCSQRPSGPPAGMQQVPGGATLRIASATSSFRPYHRIRRISADPRLVSPDRTWD